MNNHTLQMDREQAKKLMELGSHLCQLRQSQGMSLQQIAAKTMIPARLLAAIEAGKLDQLPEPVYIQGFIRRYADVIGMDGAEFASAFPTGMDLIVAETSWRGTIQAQLRPLHLYLLYMLLVMGAVGGLSFLLNRSTTPQMVGVTDSLPQTQVTPGMPGVPIGPPSPAQQRGSLPKVPSAQPTTPSTVSQKPIRVGLTLTAQSWIRVVVDGKTEYEGVLPEGTQRTWAADKRLTLRAGDAGGVIVSFNDGQAKRLGEPGNVEEITFGGDTQTGSLPMTLANPTTLTASLDRL
ncbi:MAG: RodZ domain-containing protein [Kovacikia sp.]